MLALRLEYLTGRAIATAYNDRGGTEWPPHPARVFSALVATWAEQDPRDGHPEADDERAALEWLERQEAPALAFEEGRARTVMTHYVPVNDVSLLSNQDWSIVERLADELAETTAARAVCHAEASAAKTEAQRAKAQQRLDRADDKVRKTALKLHERIGIVPAKLTDADRGAANALLPEARGRQPRSFPSLALTDPVVHLCWPQVSGTPHLPALERLATRLIRVGHSSSFVHARWVMQAPPPAWLPHDQGELLFRVVGPGQFARLCTEFERHQGLEPRVLPFRAQRYRAAADISLETPEDLRHFDAREWIVLKRIGGPALPLTRAVEVATAVRGALMRHADQPVAELISGHAEDGATSRLPHLAIVPLAHVGHRHADGALKGVALLLPRTLDDAGRRPVLRALGRWEEQARTEFGEEEDAPPLIIGLRDGVVMEVQRQTWGDPGLSALRTATWCGVAREWMSVTPVALDRNPGDLHHANPAKRDAAFREAAENIARSCAHVGLPTPEAVTVLPSGTWAGGAKAAKFPAYPPEPGKLKRVKVHARIRFARDVPGPIILGAGRYQGLGLFRPMPQEDAS